MKPKPDQEIEKYRIRFGPYASAPSDGNNGAFLLPGIKLRSSRLFVIVSDEMGWEHVSVHPFDEKRTPTWEEMCYVKDLFWEREETVIQYHPAKSRYVNIHPYTLHLWRPVNEPVPVPDLILV